MSRLLSALLLAGSLASAAGKKPITLEAIAAQKRPRPPRAPVWSPDGKRFVYLQAGKLWLYDIPSKSKQALVSLDTLSKAATKVPEPERYPFVDRGVEEQRVQWFPKGDALLVSEGGDLFLFRVAAGGWTQLTATPVEEHDPKVSPDGTRISFRRDHDLYVMEIAGGKVTRLTDDGSSTLLNGELDWVYPEELELGTAYWWAPDSRSIAYLQFDVSREPIYFQTDLNQLKQVIEFEHYPKAGDPNADVRLGIVPVTGGRTLWTDLGETRDSLRARFYWLPDSSGVAVERLNRVQNHLDLLVTDAKTGASRIVLTESDPYWINVHDEFRFLNGGKEFLWPSERDGFNHLYRYSIGGQLLGRLTRGDWEVDSLACLDEAAGQVYYVSTEASPLERQLYRVSLDGTGERRITRKTGTHAISMGPGCHYYVDNFSSLTDPPGRTIHTADGAEWAVLSEPDRKPLEEYEVLPAQILTVKAPDGAVLYARMMKPAGFDPAKKYPAIVEVYGGPHAQMVVNRWYGALTIDQVLAHNGFVLWMLDNRGSFGRGHAWESVIYHHLGKKELEDQRLGIEHLVSMGFVDPKRIGITGWSYGGFMTLYSLLHAPDTFACGLAGAPVTDWRNYDTIYTERYMGLPSQNEEGYAESAPVNAAANLKARLQLAHNREDDNVLFQNTVRMVDALVKAKKPYELELYTNKTHGLVRGRHHFEALQLRFFTSCLK